ncbi:TPA: hypothetical protein ACF74Y_003326, partial [Legionella pneumophila]
YFLFFKIKELKIATRNYYLLLTPRPFPSTNSYAILTPLHFYVLFVTIYKSGSTISLIIISWPFTLCFMNEEKHRKLTKESFNRSKKFSLKLE